MFLIFFLLLLIRLFELDPLTAVIVSLTMTIPHAFPVILYLLLYVYDSERPDTVFIRLSAMGAN